MRIVDGTEVCATEYFIWDGNIPGLGLRIIPSSQKVHTIQYRFGRRSRPVTFGPSTVLSCKQARNQAVAVIAAAPNGEDPAVERDAGRKPG